MNCQEIKNLIPAYGDGELDAPHSLEIETHLRDCAACAREQQNQQLLKTSLSQGALQFKMPPGLRKQVVTELRRTVPSPKPRWNWWSSPWLLSSATALVAMMATLLITANFNRSSSEDRLAGEITSSHVRSLMAGHLLDVASTDQHTVKPWFDGKLDFAPPVKDLAAQGFPLTGGRLDYLGGHPAVALVYARQKHILNLFIWPVTAAARPPGPPITQNGYHLINWTESGMTFWASSDLNEKELLQFVGMFRAN